MFSIMIHVYVLYTETPFLPVPETPFRTISISSFLKQLETMAAAHLLYQNLEG